MHSYYMVFTVAEGVWTFAVELPQMITASNCKEMLDLAKEKATGSADGNGAILNFIYLGQTP